MYPRKTNKGMATKFTFVSELKAAEAIMGRWPVPQSVIAKITDTVPKVKAIGNPVAKSRNVAANRIRVRSPIFIRLFLLSYAQ